MPFDPKSLDKFPTLTGVYLMRDKKGDYLYVGKANNLKQRIKQYFTPGRDLRTIIPLLVSKVETIETIIVSSEKEALLLENTLIKQHHPRYNALLKDDKSYISLKVNVKHQWPMIQLVRLKGNVSPKEDLYFGPYISAYAARQTLELMKKIFPMRQCSDRELKLRSRPCILYQMKRCIAPCVNLCTHEEYDALVKRAIQFLKGSDKQVVKSLYQEMEEASEKQEYERAGSILLTIQQLEATLEQQHIEKIGRVDSDAIGIYREGNEATISQMVFRNGKLQGMRIYSFSESAEDDADLLSSFLLQAYMGKKELPHSILLAIELPDALLIAEHLSQQQKRKLHVTCPQKGDLKALVAMAMTNAKASFEKEKDVKVLRERALLELQEKLHLNNYPRRIECFDNSHLSGTGAVAAMIVFEEGEKATRHYRKFILKETDPSDDYGALREALKRRYGKAKEDKTLPDLILIDGGKGQLSSAVRTLEDLDISTVDVAAIAKEEGRHDKGSTLERLFLPNIKDPFYLKRGSPLLHLLQQIRDEAHRFAITFQRARQRKKTLKSALEDIPGIGPTKRKRLLQHFGSAKRLKEAPDDAILSVKGISKTDLANIRSWANSQS